MDSVRTAVFRFLYEWGRLRLGADCSDGQYLPDGQQGGCAVTELEFRLLGAMQLRVDDEPAKLPGAAERGLLALLLLSPGRIVAASSLIDRLWSESALPADPLNALQLRVSKLRRALAAHGVDVIVREASGYRADVDRDRVDLHRFVSLVQAARTAARSTAAGNALALYDEALALWRAEPLADFAASTEGLHDQLRSSLSLASLASGDLWMSWIAADPEGAGLFVYRRRGGQWQLVDEVRSSGSEFNGSLVCIDADGNPVVEVTDTTGGRVLYRRP